MASRFPIDVFGEVPEAGSPILTRRVTGNAGAPITQASLTSISYSVYTYNTDTKARVVVANHSAISVTVSSVIFDTLQNDVFWQNADGKPVDDEGYNFRHQPPHAVTTTTFATAGTTYLVEYTLTPTSSGEPILLRFLLTCV